MDICAMLAGLGIMAQVHTIAVAMLAEALADYVEHREARNRDQVLKWCREIGMTPAAITALRSAKPTEEKKDEFPSLAG